MKRFAIVTLGLLAFASTASADMRVNEDYCDVFTGWRQQGAWMRVYPGQTRPRLVRDWNDNISSASIGKGCVLEIWTDANFKGQHRAFDGTRTKFSRMRIDRLYQFDKKASSLACYCNVKG